MGIETHEFYMARTLEYAEEALQCDEPPFACILVNRGGGICLNDRDRVNELQDMASHAETNLLHRACRELSVPNLQGYTLYTTVEPCVMCFTTGWLNRLSNIVFGATMAEIGEVTSGKQREITIPCGEINERSGAEVNIVGGILKAKCMDIFLRYEYSK